MIQPTKHDAETAPSVVEPGIAAVHRASPPRPPRASVELASAREEHAVYVERREQSERVSILRALLVLGVVVLAGSIWRAGLDRVFVHGWWRQW
jgi:hypothetical protein